MQKDHTSDSEHGDEEEKNAPIEGEADEEILNAYDIVKDISEDGSPIIGNSSTNSPDDEEEDHSMSDLHTEPTEDEDDDQDNAPEDEQNKDIPKTKTMYDAAKKTIATSTGNTAPSL